MRDSLVLLGTYFLYLFYIIELLMTVNKLLNLDNFRKEMANHHTSILLHDKRLIIN